MLQFIEKFESSAKSGIPIVAANYQNTLELFVHSQSRQLPISFQLLELCGVCVRNPDSWLAVVWSHA
jgi:hypothetical protein